MKTNKPKKRQRPRLTAVVIRGLRSVHNDAHGQISEREGWGDDLPYHAAEWRALEYIDALIKWFDARSQMDEVL